MDKKKRRFHLSDNVKAGILRWWIVGMCYFMIGFGTQMGLADDPLDLIFVLGVGIGLVTIVVYNPIAYSAFDIVRNGEIVNNKRKGWSGARRALDDLREIGVSLLTVILIYLTYQGVNELLVKLTDQPEGTVIIPGEPFGFATLYILFYSALVGLTGTLAAACKASGTRREENEEGDGNGS